MIVWPNWTKNSNFCRKQIQKYTEIPMLLYAIIDHTIRYSWLLLCILVNMHGFAA